MITLKTQIGGVPTMRSGFSKNFNSVSFLPSQRLVSGEFDSVVTIEDKDYDRILSASFYQEGRVSVSGGTHPIAFASRDPSVATVSPTGEITHVSDGETEIEIRVGRVKTAVGVSTEFVAAGALDVFLKYTAGSLRRAAADGVDLLTDGLTPSDTTKKLFTTQNHATGTYVRNPNVWCASLAQKLTCASPWNSRGGATRAGVAISPRHVLCAAHYPLSNGDTIRFVDVNGVGVDSTILATKTHPSYSSSTLYPDFQVCLLSEDLPPSITPCRVAPSPSALTGYMPGSGFLRCLYLDQEEKALVSDVQTPLFSCADFVYSNQPFKEELVGGDSGNPVFVNLEGELVLFSLLSRGGVLSGGSFIGEQLTEINSMIAAVDALAGISTGYRPVEADLFAYTNFSAPADPLAGIPFLFRLQTHTGDKVPLGIAVENAASDWADNLSGSGLTATSASKPISKRAVDGTPYLDFTAANSQYLNTLVMGGQVTYVALFRCKTPTYGSYWSLLEGLTDIGLDGRWGLFQIGDTSWHQNPAPSPASVRENGVAVTLPYASQNALTDWRVMTVVTRNSPNNTLRSIGQTESNYFGHFEIIALAVFDGVPTTPQIEAVESHFQSLKPS